jgi:hypothetical protein
LGAVGVALKPTLVGRPQRKRGGVRDWPVYRSEALRLASERADRHVAVMVDYFRMPHSWPGRAGAAEGPIDERGRRVEDALLADLGNDLPGRFHPCVELHEFESLLFVAPDVTARSVAPAAPGRSPSRIADELGRVRAQHADQVERIDEGPTTAPSKRMEVAIPGYDKVAWGPPAAREAGLATLRADCPWLDRWLTRLEALGDS